jgi:hypothetical protein
VIALNEEYEGSGTVFYDINKTIRLLRGQVLFFRGDTIYHGGDSITNGTRYIIAVFLYHDDDKDNVGDPSLDSPDNGSAITCHHHSRQIQNEEKSKIKGVHKKSDRSVENCNDFAFGFFEEYTGQ